jgi:chromosomal replication initiator protein
MAMPAPAESLTSLAIHSPRPRKNSTLILPGLKPALDHFLIGPENEALRELSQSNSIAQLHERSPLLLTGPTGVGKTAVAVTLATRWINDAPNRTYAIVSALDFARTMVLAIESDDMPRFREQYRRVHCLVIDNVHELSGKEAAQGELIEVLNALEGLDSLVIMTSLTLPAFLPNWNHALASRMVAGYSMDLKYPSAPTRLELIRRLSDAQSLPITEEERIEINSQLGENQSIHQLQGLLLRWQHHHRANEGFAKPNKSKVIESLVESQSASPRNPMEIAKSVARELRQTLEAMKGPGRKASVVRARGLAMYLIREWTDSSYQSIGSMFGDRDHTTVMHACRKMEEELAKDPELLRCVDRVRQKTLA